MSDSRKFDISDDLREELREAAGRSEFVVVTHGGHYRFAESLVAAESKQYKMHHEFNEDARVIDTDDL